MDGMEDADTVETDQRIITFGDYLRISTWDHETSQAKLGRRYAFRDDFPQEEYGKLHYMTYICDVAPTVKSSLNLAEIVVQDLDLLDEAWKSYQRFKRQSKLPRV